jgi:pyruvate dehydrogenase E2 component (dihydrolipoamide acetyltransferase)
MALVEIQVPDIGDFDEVGVIELLVKPGDTVKAEQSLITVESDKASMEIPSSHAGVVKDLRVQVGDKVKQGSVVLTLEVVGAVSESNSTPAQSQQAQAAIEKIAKTPTPSAAPVAAPAPDAAAPVGPIEVRVPDIGDFKDVAVIELLVKPGDTVKLEQSLFTVESDKASMEIPSPAAGVIKELKVKIGDTVNIGDLVAVLEGSAAAMAPAAVAPAAPAASPSACSCSRLQRPPRRRRYGLCGGRARAPARHARCRPAPRQPLGAQIRPRTRCAARRSQGHRPQGPHHARRRGRVSPSGDGRQRADQGPGGQGPAAGGGGTGVGLTCCPGPRWTSPSSAPWSARTSRASRRSAVPTCTATGSSSRTSPTTTMPTSPTSKPSACSSTKRTRRVASRSPCSPS